MAKTEKNAYETKDGVPTHTEFIYGENVKQVVLPECKRDEVLKVAHEIPLVGHLDSVFRKWREVALAVNLEKCAFGQNQVKFLCHIVGSDQHSPDPEIAEVLRNLSRPSTKNELSSFLGLASYYRDYIPNFSLFGL
ncbi:hypothetical protein AVEN_263721-1 [Araneus ventricosus]|uniref:Uncharacterized protein n=1 Tax=Araneus ventricosus TaxID=182803 RepID=A0A4Y2AT22_ARAVE|nr:hypothetical protein AVEN_263721-1 [Araneus ventricosus]